MTSHTTEQFLRGFVDPAGNAKRIEKERGIPAPVSKRNNKGYTAALRTLEVEDSVLLPTTVGCANSLALSVRTHEHPDWRFVVRAVEGGARVWRVK